MMSLQLTALRVSTAPPSTRGGIRRQLVTSACQSPAQETAGHPNEVATTDRRQVIRAALAAVSLMAATPLTATAAALSPTRSTELAKKNKQRQLELAAKVEKLKQAK